MKIAWKHGDRSIEFEHQPMPPEQFSAVCKLAGAAICGAVLVALVHMLDVQGLAWAVGALVLVGVYKLVKEGFG